MTDRDDLLAQAERLNLLMLEPRTTFDRALVGVALEMPDDQWPRTTDTPCAKYSVARCIEALVEADGMEEQDAREFVHYNTMGAWVGEGTPTFVDDDEGTVYLFD